MPKLTGIAVSQQNDGSLELVAASHAQGPGPTIWHTWQVAPGDEWNPWEPFGEPGTGDPGPPAMVQHAADGHLEVFTVSSGDQAVWHRRQTGPEPDKWSDWESLGQPDGDPVQGPVATTLLNNSQVMAVVIASGTLWQAVSTDSPDPQWSAWSPFGRPDGATVLAVAIATPSDGHAELVALVEWPDDGDTTPTGNRGVLWHRRQNDPATADDWSWWEPLTQPGGHSVPVGTPVLSVHATGLLELFTRTSDGAVWRTGRQNRDPVSWGPWDMLVRPGYSFGDLTAATDSASSRMLLVAPTSTGNHLWYAMQSGDDPSTWSPLSPLATVPEASGQDAGALAGALLVPDSNGRMQLFVVVPTTGNAYLFSADNPGQLPTYTQSFTHP